MMYCLSLCPFVLINEAERIIRESKLNLPNAHYRTKRLSDSLYVAIELHLALNKTSAANKILEDHKDFIDNDPIYGPRFYYLLKLEVPKGLIEKKKAMFGNEVEAGPAISQMSPSIQSFDSQAISVSGANLCIILTIEKYYEALSTIDRKLLAQVLPDDEEGYYSMDEYLNLFQSELAKFSPNNPKFQAQLSEKSNITIYYNKEKIEYVVNIMNVTKTIQAGAKVLKQSEADDFTLRKDNTGNLKIYIKKGK